MEGQTGRPEPGREGMIFFFTSLWMSCREKQRDEDGKTETDTKKGRTNQRREASYTKDSSITAHAGRRGPYVQLQEGALGPDPMTRVGAFDA